MPTPLDPPSRGAAIINAVDARPRRPEPAEERTRGPCGEPLTSLAVACPACGLLARLDVRSIDSTICPRGHPFPVGEIPGVREVLAWVEEVLGSIPGRSQGGQPKPEPEPGDRPGLNPGPSVTKPLRG